VKSIRELWYEALGNEVGVIITTSDLDHTRQQLYKVRKELNDPDLDCIAVQLSPVNPDKDLWLVKRNSK
jgi:hypothetical protein